MKRLGAALGLMAAVTAPTLAYAWDPLSLTTDLTWASKYMSDGFKVGGDYPVFQPSASVGLPLPGFSVVMWSALQLNRSNRQWDELDFMASYNQTVFSDELYAVNFHGFADYWLYPNSEEVMFDSLGVEIDSHRLKGNKLHAGFSFPKLFSFLQTSIIPSYNAYYWLYWAQDRRDQFLGGARHEFLVQLFHSLPLFIPGAVQQYVGLSGSVNYHDGVFGVRPGWSHSTAALTTGAYAIGGLFALSANYQWSYQDSVNAHNELWSTLSFTRTF